MITAPISASASGDNAVVAAVAGRRIRVLAYVLVAAGAVNVKWRSATTDKTGSMSMPGAGAGVSAPGSVSSMGWLAHVETAQGQALNLNLSDAVGVGGHLTYEVST